MIRMTRQQAALLLGVDLHATPTEVNHAWRVWARLAHPDAGGDRAHFEALAEARALLVRGGAASATEHFTSDEPRGSARLSWRQVCRRPDPRAIITLCFVALVGLLATVASPRVSTLMAGLMLGVAAAGFAVVAERTVLQPFADTGHRIGILCATWLPAVGLLLLGSAVRGVDVIAVLPIVALPFVASVALVNPGAGLWRPVGSSS